MSKPVYIVGLDIGTTKIACIVGEKMPNGKIEIRGYGKTESTGVKRGMVFNIDQTVDAIKRAVAQASEQSKVEIKSVNVGIAGHHIKSLQHSTKLYIPPRPSLSPGYQFCTVEYFTSASFSTLMSTTAA